MDRLWANRRGSKNNLQLSIICKFSEAIAKYQVLLQARNSNWYGVNQKYWWGILSFPLWRENGSEKRKNGLALLFLFNSLFSHTIPHNPFNRLTIECWSIFYKPVSTLTALFMFTGFTVFLLSLFFVSNTVALRCFTQKRCRFCLVLKIRNSFEWIIVCVYSHFNFN